MPMDLSWIAPLNLLLTIVSVPHCTHPAPHCIPPHVSTARLHCAPPLRSASTARLLCSPLLRASTARLHCAPPLRTSTPRITLIPSTDRRTQIGDVGAGKGNMASAVTTTLDQAQNMMIDNDDDKLGTGPFCHAFLRAVVGRHVHCVGCAPFTRAALASILLPPCLARTASASHTLALTTTCACMSPTGLCYALGTGVFKVSAAGCEKQIANSGGNHIYLTTVRWAVSDASTTLPAPH